MEKQDEQIKTAKGLAKWFAVDITIRLFGVIIWEYHFPPQKS